MNLPLNVAVVGCGEIGSMRAAAVTRCPGLRLRAVCDINRSRAEALAGRFGAVAMQDAQAAVSAPEVDLVVVSTSNDLHAPVAIAAMNAGKHVLCEKPLARTLEEARAMVHAAIRNGVQLKAGFNHRYYPCVLKTAQLVRSGAVGEPISLRASIGHPGGAEFFSRWFGNPSIAGGGTLVDNGVHMLDVARWLLGEVKDVFAMKTAARVTSGSEDNCVVLLRCGSAMASIASSWNKWRGYFEIELLGTQGYIHCSYPPMKARFGRVAASNGRVKQERFFFLRDVVSEKLFSYRWTTIGTFVGDLSEWLEAIRGKRSPADSAQDGYRAVELVQAVYRSAEQGVRVPTPPSDPFQPEAALAGRL